MRHGRPTKLAFVFPGSGNHFAGMGRALLPHFVARRDAALVPMPPCEPPPRREVWLLVERQVRQIRRVSLALGWVEAVVRDAFPTEAPA